MYYMPKGKISLSDEIYNQMLVKISEGTWKEGERIPSELKLCEMYRASRVTVRNAIQKLQVMGLIETKQGIGSFVSESRDEEGKRTEFVIDSDISGEAYLEFFEFRQAIEFKAMELFSARATEEDFKDLETIVAEMEECCGDRVEFSQVDFRFHLKVVEGARNKFLAETWGIYSDVFYHYIEEINRFANISEDPHWHREIIECLRNKKPGAAQELMNSYNFFYHHWFRGGARNREMSKQEEEKQEK